MWAMLRRLSIPKLMAMRRMTHIAAAAILGSRRILRWMLSSRVARWSAPKTVSRSGFPSAGRDSLIRRSGDVMPQRLLLEPLVTAVNSPWRSRRRLGLVVRFTCFAARQGEGCASAFPAEHGKTGFFWEFRDQEGRNLGP